MITYYYKTMRTEHVRELDEYKSGSWICATDPSSTELEYLADTFKLDAGHLQDALDADEMPRLEQEGDLTYIFVRYAYTNEDLELSTAPFAVRRRAEHLSDAFAP